MADDAARLPIGEVARQAGMHAVRRWLEMTGACECETLDVCSLFDDRVLSMDARERPRWGQVVLRSG